MYFRRSIDTRIIKGKEEEEGDRDRRSEYVQEYLYTQETTIITL
jgi:hypothetical protein